MRFLLVLVVIVGLGYAGWRSGDVAPMDEIAAARAATGAAFESRIVTGADGVPIHAVFVGPEGGEPVVLIHGFPEFWYSWRRQAADLAAAGYRVAIPDLRGYNRSGKPAGREAYTAARYAADIIALLDAEGWATTNLAGHDIGAIVAWELIFNHADRIDRAVVFNIAPMEALIAAAEAGGASTSWYRLFFKAPLLPEIALRAGRYRLLRRTFQTDAAPGAFSDADEDIYAAAWARDNAISSMLGFYRADGLQGAAPALYSRKPSPPTYFIGAGQDRYVPEGSIELTAKLIGEQNVEVWPAASHWVLQEEPAMTARTMIRWFGSDAE